MDHKPITIASLPAPVNREIVFNADKGIWAIKISKDGIKFNREIYPESTPDDFALCFINILEKNFDVQFIPKKDSQNTHDLK